MILCQTSLDIFKEYHLLVILTQINYIENQKWRLQDLLIFFFNAKHKTVCVLLVTNNVTFSEKR